MDVPQIEYAPTPPLYHRKRVRRMLFVLALLVIFAPLVWKFGPFVWKQAQILYWQRQAMNYSPPGDQIVFDDVLAAPGIRSTASDLIPVDIGNGYGRTIPPAKHFADLVADLSRPNLPTMYLGGRRSRLGNIRLVYVRGVERSDGRGDPAKVFMLAAQVYKPATILRSATEVDGLLTATNIYFPGDAHVRAFAGQSATDDPSHFIIQLESDSQRVTIDGWLLDDDNVRLERRP